MSAGIKVATALEPGDRILATGANGYIVSHVVELLLSLGYLVRGTVREDKPWLVQLFKFKYGPDKFETVIVPNLDSEQALLQVLNGISGVVHVVSMHVFSRAFA